ncbi:MAG TPA: formylglycine-generating enzyme family protein [bacterium]|nr:formylglycine-generating enzyme family protein [bacterium]HQL61423.1 formylglycine-generating enzyme family protein [bacterium]
MDENRSLTNCRLAFSPFALCLLSALTMSYGWGFRGEYGHEAGAMVAAALMAIALCLASGRPDWYKRCAVVGFFSAVGWAFGGQFSYMEHSVFYAHSDSFPDVLYSYGVLFLLGGIWAGIGGSILILSLTEKRSRLEKFIGPIVVVYVVWILVEWFFRFSPDWVARWMSPEFHRNYAESLRGFQKVMGTAKVDWMTASTALITAALYWVFSPGKREACRLIMLISAGWLISAAFFMLLIGLPLAPPHRGENWAGTLGVFFTMFGYLTWRKHRAGRLFMSYCTLAGGFGFTLANFIRIPFTAAWGPIANSVSLKLLGGWKTTEQGFGLLMGLGVAFGILRLLRGRLPPPEEDTDERKLNELSTLGLLVPILWFNLHKNIDRWIENQDIISHDLLFGFSARAWYDLIFILLCALVIYAVFRNRRSPLAFIPATDFGTGQLLYLFYLTVTLVGAFMLNFVEMKYLMRVWVECTFWITCVLCAWLVVRMGAGVSPPTFPDMPSGPVAVTDRSWKLGVLHWIVWIAVPIIMLLLTEATLYFENGPISRGRLRFGPNAYWRTFQNAPGAPSESPSETVKPKPTPTMSEVLEEKTFAGIVFVHIPPGTFVMGTEIFDQHEKPAHRVRISNGFWIGKTEITNKQWQEEMGAPPSPRKEDNMPVVNVSWIDCQEFVDRMSRRGVGTFRLPTEAEWEYACRAGTDSDFSFGDSLTGDQANFESSQPVEVGQYPPNAWGLCDMHGNVMEWCWDWYDPEYYGRSPTIDPQGPANGALRVARGGAWNSKGGECRSAYRAAYPPDTRADNLGLRLCRDE